MLSLLEIIVITLNRPIMLSDITYCRYTLLHINRELVMHMLNQEHTSGEVLQAFDRINPEDETEEKKNSQCCS